MLTAQQQADYQRDGFLLLKGAISEAEILRLETGVGRNPPLDQTLDPNAPNYPAPGRYTLATQCLKDPDLSFIVEHPSIIDPVSQLLGDDPRLTAYVIYDRTPGGSGLPAHHDYKRWRPVGSSMHWLFTIVPFCDFDTKAGPLYIAPGSHRLDRIRRGAGVCMEVGDAIKPAPHEFIDPGLQRGDLLFMNMHLWHKAADNDSDQHRVGLFNKYAAASAPPATGYYLYDEDVYRALSPVGKDLIAIHSDRTILTTRALLTRKTVTEEGDKTEVYLHRNGDRLVFPGGLASDEQAIPDWDKGNMIAALQSHLRNQVRIEVPWLSYVGDYEEDFVDNSEEKKGLCRVYGYMLNGNGFPVAYDGEWVDVKALAIRGDQQGIPLERTCDWGTQALETWLDPSVIRGKGLAQAQCRIDQFAY